MSNGRQFILGMAPRVTEILEAIKARKGQDYSVMCGSFASCLHIISTLRAVVRSGQPVPEIMVEALMLSMVSACASTSADKSDVGALIGAMVEDSTDIISKFNGDQS